MIEIRERNDMFDDKPTFEEQVVQDYSDLLWGTRDVIQFSKGYKIYEELYEEYKKYLERKEIKDCGCTMVVITRKGKNEK